MTEDSYTGLLVQAIREVAGGRRFVSPVQPLRWPRA
jgi:hypothetical protein